MTSFSLNNVTSKKSQTKGQIPSAGTRGQNATFANVKSAEDIESLDEKQLKSILQEYGRDINRIKSRTDLVKIVTRLWEKDKSTIQSEPTTPNPEICRKPSGSKFKVVRSPSPHPNKRYVSHHVKKEKKPRLASDLPNEDIADSTDKPNGQTETTCDGRNSSSSLKVDHDN